jgi:hypothetical protein
VNVRVVEDRLSPADAARFRRFEEEFLYPLGPDERFGVRQGDDPLLFFRCLGPAAMALAEDPDGILGAAALSRVRLRAPDDALVDAVYVGALKTHPRARAGRTLLRLAEAARRWAEARAVAAFGVVMAGSKEPGSYTGRLGIPLFSLAATCAVLRVDCAAVLDPSAAPEIDAEKGAALFRRLAAREYRVEARAPEARSERAGAWLALDDESACGYLEDTRLAKRLVREDGTELVSGHLSRFAYSSPDSARRLVASAARRCAESGRRFLFVGAPSGEPPPAAVPGAALASASIWTFGLPAGHWRLNTAEI